MKILKEGEAAPFGYGFVRHRIDYLGKEVAPLPLNYLIRWIYSWQQKSYVSMTREELRALKAVRALMIEAEEKGNKKGREWAIRKFLAGKLDEKVKP